jgi:pimeloyl-ACP methyl ester carboxylesterase
MRMTFSERRLPRLIAALILTIAVCGPALAALKFPANEASAHPGQLVRLPDGRHINFRCTGSGAPTVILEGGFAATSLAWFKVQPQVAKTNRVCAYDRAGYGFSDPGPLPRDGAAVARDLDQALKAGKIAGPYILVGHSAGALYMRLLASRLPAETVGMVLVDPSVEHQDDRFAATFGRGVNSLAGIRARAERCLEAAEKRALPSAEAPLAVCVPAPRANQTGAVNAAQRAQALRPQNWRTQVSELDSLWGSTSEQVDRSRASYGDMPLIVLTADGTYAAAPERARAPLATLWWGLHREIAARSSRGESRRIADSSHMMMLDKPEAIVAAIAEVSAASTNGAARNK